jgi:hypothetical protein
MGRDRWSSRRIVEDSLQIPVEAFLRWGTFSYPSGTTRTITWTNSRTGMELGRIEYIVQRDENGIAICFRRQFTRPYSAEKLVEDFTIPLTFTPCHFGGKRFWFQCCCGRRVGQLYLPPDQQTLGCRVCLNLIHRSAREHDPRAYQLARHPRALAAALGSKKLPRRLLGVDGLCVQLRWARNPRRRIPAIQS